MILELSRGYQTIISPEDFQRVSRLAWHVNICNGNPYARCHSKGSQEYLHRFLCEAKKSEEVDHVNRNTLDNRRENLRIASRSQNMVNARKRTSGFKGVWYDKQRDRWEAYGTLNCKKYHLGRHSTAEEAARAYDAWVFENFGQFALLNFPCA